MKWKFEDTRIEAGGARGKYDIILGVIATFEIRVRGRLLYREEMFPLVELCLALKQWLAVGLLSGQPFEFVSLESDEPGLVWIRLEQEGWRIGSIHQEYPETNIWSSDEIKAAVLEFTSRVEEWLDREAGVSLDSLR